MTRREAVLQTLAHRETVPVPYHLEFTQQALQKLVEYTGDPAIESGMGGYLHYGQYWGWPTELPEKPGYFRDEFGAGDVKRFHRFFCHSYLVNGVSVQK